MKYLLFYLISLQTFGQGPASGQDPAAWSLDRMPKDLETDFALSALPPHVRARATVYLLDPEKGYYIDHQGKNGFICFLVRAERILTLDQPKCITDRRRPQAITPSLAAILSATSQGSNYSKAM